MKTKDILAGFKVYVARVRVKNPAYTTAIEVAINAKNPQQARLLLQAQYGHDSIVSGITEVAQ